MHAYYSYNRGLASVVEYFFPPPIPTHTLCDDRVRGVIELTLAQDTDDGPLGSDHG